MHFQTINTQATISEAIHALAIGNFVKREGNEASRPFGYVDKKPYYLDKGKKLCPQLDELITAFFGTVANDTTFTIYEVQETDWTSELNKQRLLCWVSDDFDLEQGDLAIINYKSESHFVDITGKSWRFAKPLEPKEYRPYLYKPENTLS